MEACYTMRNGRLDAEIKAAPGAARNAVLGVKNGRLRVRIAAPAEDGKANEELRRFLAKTLGCPRGEVILVRGEKSRLKTVSLPAACREKFEEIAHSPKPG
ncbi:MAG: DUF167 domain-containing protein [Treponema sp.]|jgi:uncharacterized protein (TIGR00251 family)|nr:DUF167 domain-containing protein [Treponema sp.]